MVVATVPVLVWLRHAAILAAPIAVVVVTKLYVRNSLGDATAHSTKRRTDRLTRAFRQSIPEAWISSRVGEGFVPRDREPGSRPRG